MKQGGMNRRQERIFISCINFFTLGNFTELNSTRVNPSPRLSDRVPFGTGADITKQLRKDENHYKTYDPK